MCGLSSGLPFPPVPTGADHLADRLRINLRAAEIPASDADVERLLADGSLARMDEYILRLRDLDVRVEPDYLASAVGRADGRPPASGPLGSGSGAKGAVGDQGGIPDTIGAVAPLIRDGALSPVELLERALDRIGERDGELNAFQMVLADEARAAARTAEAEIRRGEVRGPLHGVPVAVKDLFAMAGTPLTAGAKGVLEVSETDAVAVERLRAAGAVLVGKTRLPEYAFWPGSRNPHYGPTANPRDTTRDAGGSSSGSGAAVADGMVYAALGSDTGGSIRIPAALCGVVGLKPAHGRVSLAGCVPLAWSLDHGGPLTRSAGDAAIVLDVLAGGRGAVSSGATDELAKGLRVAALGDDGTGRPLAAQAALAAWHASSSALRDVGAEVVEVDLPEMALLRAVNFLILSVEAAAFHATGLRHRFDAYGEPCRSRLLTGFAYDATDLVQAHRYRRLARQRWSQRLVGFDVLSTPSQPDVAPPLGEIASVKFTSPFNALGWPAVSVPWGTGAGGLPLATQLVAPDGREETVLRAAHVMESVR